MNIIWKFNDIFMTNFLELASRARVILYQSSERNPYSGWHGPTKIL